MFGAVLSLTMVNLEKVYKMGGSRPDMVAKHLWHLWPGHLWPCHGHKIRADYGCLMVASSSTAAPAEAQEGPASPPSPPSTVSPVSPLSPVQGLMTGPSDMSRW